MNSFTVRRIFLPAFLIIFTFLCRAQQSAIIPAPVSIEYLKGSFLFSPSVTIISTKGRFQNEIRVFNETLKKYFGFTLMTSETPATTNNIELVYEELSIPEAYKLHISTNSIQIRGLEAGIFYGFQTLLQLLPPQISEKVPVQNMVINDYPRFQWRGMHLDVSRHFFPKEFIFKYIDYLAMYKMNTFHWHLTDDQGWRIEIKKYPLLTETGAWRKGTLIGHASDEALKTDTAMYGGYYTQDEIREVVAYAQARHVTIVPEIEMPGHAMAALKAYPHLSCTGKQQDVATGWGVFDHVFCTKDEVFVFLEDVLTEVMDLFPGTYIHVGGDECPKTNWKKCPQCQARMKSEHLKDEHELQSYFITRIENFISSKGRKLIGWDEILDGGLAPNAAVMSWRGTEGGIAAARSGHYAVMTPGSHCYFDHYQGDPTIEPLAIGGYTTVDKVYSFEPVPNELNEKEASFILGAQGNLWTEYINNEKHVEYMIFPRLCALAEVVWTPEQNKNWNDFRNRLVRHFDYFDYRNVNYSMALFEIKKQVICDTINRIVLMQLSQEFNNGDIVYWFEKDGKSYRLPEKYTGPVEITESLTLLAEVRDNNGKERGYTKQDFIISKSSGAGIRLKYTPSKYYNYGSPYTLVDGISGRVPWNGKEWLGFSNTDMVAYLDLGKTESISTVTIHALKAEASWIYLPAGAIVSVSQNGKKYKKVAEINAASIEKTGRMIRLNFEPTQARFIKIQVKRAGIIGTGKSGEGNNAWLFISEIEIQ